MILGVIPARGGSKGLPGKNLRCLGTHPLLAYAIRAARESATIAEIVVSTDDPATADVARAEGVAVPRLRPADLAGDDISLWPAIRDAVGEWESRTGGSLEAVAVLQPTSPLRTGADIDGCVARFRELRADICASVYRPKDSPHFNLVTVGDGSPWAEPASPLMRQHARRQTAPPIYALNGAVWVIRRSVLDRLESQFDVERYAIYEMPRARSIDIDTAEDLALAEWWLARRAP